MKSVNSPSPDSPPRRQAAAEVAGLGLRKWSAIVLAAVMIAAVVAFFALPPGMLHVFQVPPQGTSNSADAVPRSDAGRSNQQLKPNSPAGSQLDLSQLPPPTQRSIQAWQQLVAANFAGDQACASCHEKETEAHRRSGHSRTLTAMGHSVLADMLIAMKRYQDPRREQTFEFVSTADQVVVRDAEHAPGINVPVTWLLGSGTHAQTPIAVDESTQSGVELRWSAFDQGERIGLTPDHDRFDEFAAGSITCFGRPMDASDIRACLGCHSTLTPPAPLPILNSLVVENVGCERCHGPRKKHVELAHQGLAEQAQPLLTYDTAEKYLKACADCHRDESSVDPHAMPHELVRFQPYGIQRSRCYLETPGHLTCSTCHDPHDTVSLDRSRSIEQCQQCHVGPPDAPSSRADGIGPQRGLGQVSASECPHQPQGDCISCHMPAIEWTAGISFHDHWIRVVRDDKRADDTSAAVTSP